MSKPPATVIERLCAAVSAAWPGNEWTFREEPWASHSYLGVRVTFTFRHQIELTLADEMAMEAAVLPLLVADTRQSGKNAVEVVMLDAPGLPVAAARGEG